MLREERLRVYSDALAHAVDQERRLNAVWATDGETVYNISPKPPGAPLSLPSLDEITVRMHLLAEDEADRAWVAFVTAWEGLHFWAENLSGGDPEEDAPEDLVGPLRAAIKDLKGACRRSLE